MTERLMSISVLNYNRLEYTKQTIQRLIDITTVKHEFIFIDNGSVDGTREYLKSLEHSTNAEKVTYIFNDRNLGVAGGKNEALLVATGDYVVFFDDDIYAAAGYDGYFIEACDNITHLGVTGLNVEGKPYKSSVVDGVEVCVKRGNLGGASLCFPRRVLDQIGFFAADFVYGGEDCDIYVRLKRLGLISAYIAPMGIHMDKNENAEYVALKKSMHLPTSKPFRRVGSNELNYKRTGSVYVPYKKPRIDTTAFDQVIKKPK